jgi:hypothetical protein
MEGQYDFIVKDKNDGYNKKNNVDSIILRPDEKGNIIKIRYDENNNGRIDGSELKFAERDTGVLGHYAGTTNIVGGWSLACQVINGAYFIDAAGVFRTGKDYTGIDPVNNNTYRPEGNKTRGAYDYFTDVIKSSGYTNVKYHLINDKFIFEDSLYKQKREMLKL